MAQPTANQAHIDGALTDFSVAYVQDADNFVADKVFPVKPVDHMTDKYHVFNKNDWLRDDAVVKDAPGTKTPRSGFTLSQDSYSAEPWKTGVAISAIVRGNADPAVPLDEAATELATQRMLIRRERLFVENFFTTGVWATDLVGGTDFAAFSDYSSDPQKTIDDAQANVLEATGKLPGTLCVGYRVHKALKRHPIIKDAYKYTSADSITEEMIARVLELDRYVVSKASYATNVEGATAVTSFIAGGNALLVYNDESPSIMSACAGAIFAWSNAPGSNNSAGIVVDRFYDEDAEEEVIRGKFAFDMKATGTDLGVFLSGAI